MPCVRDSNIVIHAFQLNIVVLPPPCKLTSNAREKRTDGNTPFAEHPHFTGFHVGFLWRGSTDFVYQISTGVVVELELGANPDCGI